MPIKKCASHALCTWIHQNCPSSEIEDMIDTIFSLFRNASIPSVCWNWTFNDKCSKILRNCGTTLQRTSLCMSPTDAHLGHIMLCFQNAFLKCFLGSIMRKYHIPYHNLSPSTNISLHNVVLSFHHFKSSALIFKNYTLMSKQSKSMYQVSCLMC